jgi:hypothetical protein
MSDVLGAVAVDVNPCVDTTTGELNTQERPGVTAPLAIRAATLLLVNGIKVFPNHR